MIKSTDLQLTYSDGTIGLHPATLNIQAGELVYITGPSGSGKTSLLKLMMGIEYPTGGTIETLGVNIARNQSKKINKMRHQIGPVFQDFRLIKGKTAMENVMLGLRFIGYTPKQIKEEAEIALIQVGLAHKLHAKVEKLSWGESQRVAIARAVARKPLLILADEPTGNLDYANSMTILNLLISFRNERTAVVMTTHATHLIQDLDNTTYITLDQGHVRIERSVK